MRLRQIEVFHAIYSSGSMTNAAALLNVSQPSVSKVLAHAEQQLGYRLFDRVKGRLIPTPEAHQLFVHVSAVYEDIDRLRNVAMNIRDAGAGRIRIASTPAFGLEVLPKAVASFRSQNPETIFEIETLHLDEITHALLESRIDIGLAFDPIVSPGIRAQKIASGRFVVLAPMTGLFGDKMELTVEELADHPFIALNSRGPLGQALSEYLGASKTELNIVAWTETYHVAKVLVASGTGITIADDVTARSTVAGDVRRIKLHPALKFNVKTMHLASAPPSIGAKTFTTHLAAFIRNFLDDA